MYAWAISGGGSKWAWELGALQALADSGYDPDIVTGISAGALHAAKLCQYPVGRVQEALDDERALLDTMRDGLIFEHWYPGGLVGDVIGVLFKRGVYDASPLHRLVSGMMDVPAIRNSGRVMSVGCVSLNTGRIAYFGPHQEHVTDDVLVKAVIASASYPAFFEPVAFLGQVWSDGGLRTVTPLREAIRLGATEVDVICAQPADEGPWEPGDKPVLEQVARLVGVMSGEINNNDIALAIAEHPEVKVRVFRPAFNVGDGLSFDRETLRGWFEMAREDTRIALQSVA